MAKKDLLLIYEGGFGESSFGRHKVPPYPKLTHSVGVLSQAIQVSPLEGHDP